MNVVIFFTCLRICFSGFMSLLYYVKHRVCANLKDFEAAKNFCNIMIMNTELKKKLVIVSCATMELERDERDGKETRSPFNTRMNKVGIVG